MGDEIKLPVLTHTNWNEEWKALQTARNHSDDASAWDEKAKTFPVKHGSQKGYVDEFLARADIHEGDTVFDMGCGTGALATPLALKGHRVIACDFSQGMLDVMLADQRSLSIECVEAHRMSWQDDWERFGITQGCADVAIASRSIATDDLEGALMKLHRIARRRVCVTLAASLSPRADSQLLEAAGFSDGVGADFLYAFNILAANGIKPEVSYIPSARRETFDSPDDALATYSKIVRDSVRGLVDDEDLSSVPTRLKPWLDSNLVRDDEGYRLERDRIVRWAFISWNTK